MADDLTIKAIPTKELFVFVLTRDIRLEEAVLDLLDNCIDGAKRLQPDEEKRLDERWVRIEFSKTEFSILDNCGGISVNTARNYAFRFGRDPKMATTPNSIGQFGVGMKRALLRFGRHFKIESTTDKEHFSVTIDVKKWLQNDEWQFEFDQIREAYKGEVPGTKITVSGLTDDASARFPVAEFDTQLRNLIEQNAQSYIARGLTIEVNKKPIWAKPFKILFDDNLIPALKEKNYESDGQAPVFAQFICGLGPSTPMEAGWYVACNGRVIMSADQSWETGWDTVRTREGVGAPKFHNQFSRFRGYVSFQCRDAARLPWNTMKTGVDPDAVVYQDARREMIALMRPVIDFLNNLDAEKDEPEDERPLTKIVDGAKPVAYNAIPQYASVFKVTTPARPPKPATTTIQFKRPKKEVEELIEAIGAGSAREAGIMAWEEALDRYVND
ncbi:ATP-binding protein [Rhizobium ruizarguesonis]|uniref:ATP-binding protein n=1 Tax=Rhizobium ruizarguesonis TaxID=2081791 RepID=UPI001031D476|nr:ATP-binding protein [Rhizobium ruizarguesonis]TAU02185.1 hypothetical protein ELI53_22895 [Rhizobium ruizarguesonis]